MTLDPVAALWRTWPLLALLGLAACGGGGDGDGVAGEGTETSGRQVVQKGGDCSGSCTGGGGTPVAGATNPLPTTAPAPDIVMRDSFGPGPAGLRPKGGKGDMRSTFIGTTLSGFWVEWPGSKNTSWITPAGEATWKFTAYGSPDDLVGNPHELPSPLEPDYFHGNVWSDTTDGTTGGFPVALIPAKLPTTPYAVSIEATPTGAIAGPYVALGLTDSAVTLNNLTTVGKVALVLRTTPGNPTGQFTWELWQGGVTRTLLASGLTDDSYYNQMVIGYDPVKKRVWALVNGVSTASFPMDLGVPRYAGFEGTGMVDNFVIRTLPVAAQ